LVALKEAGKLDAISPEDLAGLYACAKTGLENEKSGLGCYAMAPGDYDKYSDFFDAVCNDYHNNPAGDKVHVTNWSMEGVEGLPEDGQLDISKLGLKEELSMRVRVGRNLTSFPLPGSCHRDARVPAFKLLPRSIACATRRALGWFRLYRCVNGVLFCSLHEAFYFRALFATLLRTALNFLTPATLHYRRYDQG